MRPSDKADHAVCVHPAMDEEEVKKLVVGLTSRDRNLQSKLIDTYCTDDVEFVHILFRTRGKQEMKAIYRLVTTVVDYKIDFYDIISVEDRMALWVDLKIKTAPFYLWRYHFPCIVLLYFRRDPATGRNLICKQVDHHSAYVLTWWFGWPWISLFELLLQPCAGHLFVFMSAMLDAVGDGVEAAKAMVRSLVAAKPLKQALGTPGHADGPTAEPPVMGTPTWRQE